MNYYNPYFYNMPGAVSSGTGTGLFSRLFGGLSFGRIISGTERVLNFANQAIPLVKQVKPIIGNAKTMFRVMNEFKKNEKPINNSVNNNINSNINNTKNTKNENYNTEYSNNNEPTFFM